LIAKSQQELQSIKQDARNQIEHADDANRKGALTAIVSAVTSYETGLQKFAELEDANKKRLSEMFARTEKLEKLANEIRVAQGKFYDEMIASRQTAQEEQKLRLLLMEQSTELIQHTLRARQNKTMYRLTGDSSFSRAANGSIRDMFMTSLGMKEMAKGGEGEAAVGRVLPVVNAYRKGFGELLRALSEGTDTTEVEDTLSKVSARVTAYTAAIGRQQKGLYEDSLKSYQAANKRVSTAIEAHKQSLHLLSLVRQLRLFETKYIRSRNEEFKNTAAKTIKSLFIGVKSDSCWINS